MNTYYYCPVNCTIDELEVLRQLYRRCSDTKEFICSYSENEIVNSCDRRLGITRRRLSKILSDFESRGWIEIVEKNVGRNKSKLRVTFKSNINK